LQPCLARPNRAAPAANGLGNGSALHRFDACLLAGRARLAILACPRADRAKPARRSPAYPERAGHTIPFLWAIGRGNARPTNHGTADHPRSRPGDGPYCQPSWLTTGARIVQTELAYGGRARVELRRARHDRST